MAAASGRAVCRPLSGAKLMIDNRDRKSALARSSAISSHFGDETCSEANLDRPENKHRDYATAANPFAFTKLRIVNLRNLILRALASNYGNRPPEASFMPILLACLELRTDLPLAV